jgi:hypothetical protein
MATKERVDYKKMVTADELTPEEAREIFDRAAREEFGISGEEFLKQWDRGDYADTDDPRITRLEILMPLARPDAA